MQDKHRRHETGVAAAHRFARSVLSGDVPACKFLKQACRRHARDLKASREPDAKYYFDTAAAERAIRFIEKLPHTKGKWARGDKGRAGSNKIRLEAWQAFIVSMIFGWKRVKDGFRRFRRVYLEIARKNGKSLLASAIGLYMFVADNEFGAEVYSGATSEKQAWEVFRPAHLICKRTPALVTKFGVAVHAKALSIAKEGGRFEPVIGKPGDGASPHCAIVDEYHEHLTDSLYDTMETGMGARDQPLMLVITTAGEDIDGPCHSLRGDLVKVLSGVLEDEEMFGIIFTVDDPKKWTSDEAILKANPNAGISVSLEYLQNQVRKALNSPRRQGTVKTKHLNIWVAARDAFFDYEKWNSLGNPDLKIEDFKDHECVLAMDVAYKDDFLSTVKVFHPPGRFVIFSKHYLPEEKIQDEANRHYQGWLATGDLTQVDGEVNDLLDVEDDLVADGDLLQINSLPIDPYRARHFGQRLQDEHGLPVFFYSTTLKNMSEPMKEINALMLAGKIEHDGNKVMNWMMSNVVNSKKGAHALPAKENNARKIDGPVALIMGMGMWLFEGTEDGSYLENNEMVVI